MKTADEMFADLGYVNRARNENAVSYVSFTDNRRTIDFYKNNDDESVPFFFFRGRSIVRADEILACAKLIEEMRNEK